jgi:hypothetical protein
LLPVMFYGGCVRADFGSAGLISYRFLTPHIAATSSSCENDSDGFNH